MRGSNCACASRAATSAAAIARRTSTPPSTSTQRGTRSSARCSPVKAGAGATSTTRWSEAPLMSGPGSIAFTGLAALAVAIGIGRFAFTPILPMMQDDAALTLSQAGWLASSNYAGYLAGALTAGARIRSDVAIRAGLLIIGVSTLAMGLTQHLLPWLALRFVAGVASAWVLVFVSAWALEHLAALRRPNLNGTVFAGVGTGIVIAGGACLVAMQLNASSTTAWFALGVLSIGITAALWTLFGRGPLPAAQHAGSTIARGAGSSEHRR